jgi:hypothetical protein
MYKAALAIPVLLALLAVSGCYRQIDANSCSEIKEIAKTTKCVVAAGTAWGWRNQVDILWFQERLGLKPDCDEWKTAVDQLSAAADRCREVCDVLDCPSKSLTPERCRME